MKQEVDIKVWEVVGQVHNYGPFFTEAEAERCRHFNTGGWGEVVEKTVKATLATEDKASGK